MTARPVGDGDGQDELRGLLEGVIDSVLGDLLSAKQVDLAAAQLLPVVTAWADARARERAAEELRAAALDWPPTWAVDPATYLEDRADALAADDRTGQR